MVRLPGDIWHIVVLEITSDYHRLPSFRADSEARIDSMRVLCQQYRGPYVT